MQTWVLSKHATTLIAERGIRLEWIDLALSNPETVVADPVDTHVSHAPRLITDADSRVLRVVYSARTSPTIVVTVFFDRREKEAP